MDVPLCQVNRENHYGICSTLKVTTSNYREDSAAEHPGIELCFTLPGSYHRRALRNRAWLLSPGDLMVFNGSERHVEECSKTPSIPQLRSVIIAPDFVTGLLQETDVDAAELVFEEPLVVPSPRLTELLHALFVHCATPHTSSIAYDCVVAEIAIELVTRWRHSASERISNFSRTGHFPSHFAKAKAIMREEFADETLDLQRLAASAGLSKFHFVRDFRNHVGTSPMRYLIQLKIDAARERLANTSLAVIDIASAVGFADLSTFNKAFKRWTGLTPSGYRALARR